ncbi:MAG: DNA glycosylase AlkZ-like family protein [Candidatus Thorarchaeota archaeon]
MENLDLNQVNNFVLQKLHLTQDSKLDNILKITEDLCGLHATDLKTSYLSLLARTNKFQKSDLENELYIKKTLARIRGMRRTLFIETKDMIPIIYSATFKLIDKSFEKFMEFHKVTLNQYKEVSQAITKILDGRELSASEIRKELNSKLNIPAIIQVMCNQKLLLRVKPVKDWKDRRSKYALFKDYFPEIHLDNFSEEEAINILVEKYLKAYEPVTDTDISWWTGLTKTQTKNALKKSKLQLENIKINSIPKTFKMIKQDVDKIINNSKKEESLLMLLPSLDPYPMGYKDREKYIIANNYNYLFDRSGNITSTIFLDGIAIGVWDIEEKPEKIVKFHLFRPYSKELLNELYSAAEKVGVFYFDDNVTILECKSMIPLTERNAGGFMSPLKNC